MNKFGCFSKLDCFISKKIFDIAVFEELLYKTREYRKIIDLHCNEQCFDIQSVGKCKLCNKWMIKFVNLNQDVLCKNSGHTILVRINDSLGVHNCKKK